MAAAAPKIVNYRMPDGSVRKWDKANEPKPDSIGNGSRNGFLYNCYHHSLGRFFQETIKNGIVAVIRRIHDKEIPRYDKQAYIYDDPRLQKLDQIITETINEVIDDTDRERKREILLMCKDICMFMLKEDIFYRPRTLKGGVKAAKEILTNEALLTSITPVEAYNLARFSDGHDHAPDFSDLPMEERMLLPKEWTGLP